MPANIKRLKLITLSLDGANYECQVSNWQVVNNTPEPAKIYTYCADGETFDETDDAYALALTFFADWTVGGISDVLQTLDKQTVAFTLKHHPDDPLWAVQWTGQCRVMAPTAGGEVRTNESQTVTFPIVGKPVYSRVI